MYWINEEHHARVLAGIARPGSIAEQIARMRDLQSQRRRWIAALVAAAVMVVMARMG
jgi:hypothetical protein